MERNQPPKDRRIADPYVDRSWEIADPQNRVLSQNAADYIAMRIIHASGNDPMGPYNRFRFKGEGLKVRMN